MSIAVGYLRKSSAPSRRTHTVSFEIQEQETRALAIRFGDGLAEVLSDWGKSGGSAKRPAYQRLLAMVDAGEVKAIYSFSLSRLSRSVADFADLLERCKAHGVAVRLVQEGEIDWKTATGRLFAGMVAQFAQFERELGAERNAAAAAERRERGDVMGQAPYGFTIVNGRLVARKDERPDMVFDAFREAKSFGGAARLLNEWQVPTRRAGTRWVHGVVADIIRAQGPADLRPALVKRRAASPIGGALFSGLLRCTCGATLTPRKEQGANAAPGHTAARGYYCSRSAATPAHGPMYVPEGIILVWAKDEAAHLLLPMDMVTVATSAEREIRAIDERRTRVVDAHVEGVISKPDRDARLAKLDAERAQLTARSAAVTIPALDWAWPPEKVNAVCRSLWDRIELDADLRPVRAEWRVPEWRA